MANIWACIKNWWPIYEHVSKNVPKKVHLKKNIPQTIHKNARPFVACVGMACGAKNNERTPKTWWGRGRWAQKTTIIHQLETTNQGAKQQGKTKKEGRHKFRSVGTWPTRETKRGLRPNLRICWGWWGGRRFQPLPWASFWKSCPLWIRFEPLPDKCRA